MYTQVASSLQGQHTETNHRPHSRSHLRSLMLTPHRRGGVGIEPGTFSEKVRIGHYAQTNLKRTINELNRGHVRAMLFRYWSVRSLQRQIPRNFFFYSPNHEELAHYFHAALDLVSVSVESSRGYMRLYAIIYERVMTVQPQVSIGKQ